MDMRDNTTTGDSGLDKGIELFITSDCKLQVSWSDSLHLKILRSIEMHDKEGAQVAMRGHLADTYDRLSILLPELNLETKVYDI